MWPGFALTNFSRKRLSWTPVKNSSSPVAINFRAKSRTPALETPSHLLVLESLLSQLRRLRDLIEIGKQLDLIMVCAENVRFKRVIVFAGGDSRIGICRLVT